MKTLYESILGSTKSGKDKIVREKIEAWIDSVSQDKNISHFGYNCKNKFTINNDLTISYSGNLYLDVCFINGRYEEITQIPEYISFNRIEGDFQIKLYTLSRREATIFRVSKSFSNSSKSRKMQILCFIEFAKLLQISTKIYYHVIKF